MTDLPPELSTLSALAGDHLCRITSAGRPVMSEEAEGELVAWLRGVL